MSATKTRLESISMDVGRILKHTSLRKAIGVEVCDCPRDYNATSCQDPGLGFYRYFKEHFVTSEIIIDLVGSAKKCQCNGRSDICDMETGECLVSFKNGKITNSVLHMFIFEIIF